MDYTKIVPEREDTVINLNRQCRICMEGEGLNLPLLSPCRCSGTIRYSHEECLKTWIVSYTEDIAEACCEICKTPLLMEFKMHYKCRPEKSCENSINSCFFVPISITIIIILLIIVYILADKSLSSTTGNEELGYSIALITTCSIAGLILAILIICSIKRACIIPEIKN